jgi:hypothetical protein
MPTTRFKRMALARLLVGGCAFVFGAAVLIVPGQAQFVPPPAPPPPAPVFNPPSPDRTVPQPSYTPLSPSTPSTAPESSGPESTVPGSAATSPANKAPPSTTAQSGRGVSVAKRSIHHQRHHHHRVRFAGYALGSHYCGGSPCVRIHPSAFYEGPASGLWWPGYYDYAPGQFGRGRPRNSGYWRPTGYHGD